MRHACNRRLRKALHHWARVAVQHDPPSRKRFDAARKRGQSFGRALRGVADRLLYVVCTLLRQQTDDDPERAAQAAR
jgi:hypothetical protein